MTRALLILLALAGPAHAASLDTVEADWARRRGGGHHRSYREHHVERRTVVVPARRIRARHLLVPVIVFGGSDGPQTCFPRGRVVICP